MAAAIPAVLGVAGAAFGIDQQRHAANQANDIARNAQEASLVRRYTNNGSSVDPRTGAVNIDPSVRGLQQRSLSYIPGYQNQLQNSFGQYSSGLGNIISGLQGNQNAYVQARQNPLMQQQARALGSLQQGNALRGISGSSFANQSENNLNTDYGRAIGDQGALAVNDSLSAQAGLYGNLYNAGVNNVAGQSALTNQYNQVGIQNLQQELAALGLSQANISGMVGAGKLGLDANQGYMTGLGNTLSGLGSALGGLSSQNQQQQLMAQYNYAPNGPGQWNGYGQPPSSLMYNPSSSDLVN